MSNVENTIMKFLSIWLGDLDFYNITPYRLINMMRSEYALAEDSKKYADTIIGLFREVGYEFVEDLDKKRGPSACEINFETAFPLWIVFQEFEPDVERYNLESCISRLEHFQKYYGVDYRPSLIHMGDCTKVPMSCAICSAEESMNDLRMFITMVCWKGIAIKRIAPE